MNEEIITSGRMNPGVDPQLHIWGWEIPTYLFLGGLAAGILFFAAYFYLQGKESQLRATIKLASMLTPLMLVTGLFVLWLDLNHKPYFWRLYTSINLQSPMSWGAWTLMVITPLAFIWPASFLREIFPTWNWKFKWINNLVKFLADNRKIFAWIMIFYSVILGIYTGILLSAFNARPLWNTSILGPLFLASGMSAGAATIMLMSRTQEERKLFSRIDLILIGVELFLIIHMFMGFLASTRAQIDAAELFLGGPYTLLFWTITVFTGMIVPAALEFLELRGRKIPVYIPAFLILIGSITLRFIIVYAGQASRYLY